MRLLFFGDIVGRPGRRGVAAALPNWVGQYSPDIVVANAENSAGGMGITADVGRELYSLGINVLTLGNHAWHKKESFDFLDNNLNVLRPANMPPGAPGHGYGVFDSNAGPIGIVNLCGRVFVGDYDDPFRAIDAILEDIATPCVMVDFHAETSSEKQAFGWYVDGRISAMVGTHTHVQTADERILPRGTAYITDVGMCGPMDSVIGMDKDIVLRRFTSQMPAKFEVPDEEPIVCAVVIDIDAETGQATMIQRLQQRPDQD